MVVAVLFKAGAHDPVIPLVAVVGKGDKAAPTHIGLTCVKAGVMIGFTVIVIKAGSAHWFGLGVKV
ncbi:hypothetical protein DBR32_09640 [Taibaiella sp. KBW10]|nr:hypothetical protein DBR32_09640 [Taibaiella sp. KBW10]